MRKRIIKETDVILNRAKDYYEYDKERLREQAKYKFRNLSDEKNNNKREYLKNRYCNMSEEKKQELNRLKSLNIIINKICCDFSYTPLIL